MRLSIDSSKRFLKIIILFGEDRLEAASVESDEDILFLIDSLLKKSGTSLSDLTSVSAKIEGESNVGINIGLSAANALNYGLGLKKADELEFPPGENGSFP